ncbi:MAG: xanthine dehydrogenase family protein molybdopterin-binding subunit [Thaumarchaeota archaeon]|nr:xanthine dehydrogenase family protein molybdopterin-binding subunit [Nitrososphaerota archaeon]
MVIETTSAAQIQDGLARPRLVVGSHPRMDGFERASGRAKFAGDWKVPGMLYARMLTSTVPHGRIRAIDSANAASMPGVKAIITCLDDNPVWSAGEREHQRRVFADRVRFIGDIIGAIAATSRAEASEAVKAVAVEYEELPAALTIEDSRREGAPKIWDEGNTIGPLASGFGDLQAAFAGADFTYSAEYSTSRVVPAPLEPAVSLAWWDDDKVTLVAATQSIHPLREGLAQDLGIPMENVRVVTLYKGGGFGGKTAPMVHDFAAVLLAKKAGRPVMVEYSRLEDFIGVHGRWATVQHLRGAVKKGGDGGAKLLAVEMKAECDLGAYTRAVKVSNFVQGTEWYYDCDAWKGEVLGVYTNTPATGSMRAPVGPHSCFATESFVDEVAHALGVNPLKFRLINAATLHHRQADFTSNHLKDCLLAGAAAISWGKRWRPPTGVPREGEKNLSGLGVAIASWPARIGRGEAVLRLRLDGTLEVKVGLVDIGTGSKTMMAMIAGRTLGVPVEKVEVVWGDTDASPYSVGESGSRTTGFTGTAVRAAASQLKDKILLLAAGRLPVTSSAVLTLRDGAVFTNDGRKVSFKDLLESSGLEAIEEKAATEPTLPDRTERHSFAAHFAQVEVDQETGAIQVVRYVAVHDSGEIVNRLTAESQVQGGVIMGLGMALSERILVDRDMGVTQNPSFLSYRIPNNGNVPKVEAIFVEHADPYGPKSLGEIPAVPVPAAIGNAVFNATGVRMRKLPLMPEDLLRAMDSSLA